MEAVVAEKDLTGPPDPDPLKQASEAKRGGTGCQRQGSTPELIGEETAGATPTRQPVSYQHCLHMASEEVLDSELNLPCTASHM